MSPIKKSKYLLLFAQEFVEFRYEEIKSLIKLFKIDVKIPEILPHDKPFWILENIDENDVRKIARRSVSLKLIAEIWTSGKSFDEFHDNSKNYVNNIDTIYSKQSFKFQVETYNKHLKLKEKIEKIETMNYLDKHLGDINLNNPDNRFIYFEYYGMDHNNPKIEEIYFGRFITEGQRDLINFISLKKRKFIGNTSMEAQLSLLMANQGLCKENDLMFDPFCGTGSMLIAAALFKSYVIGSDIDYLTLHGKTRPVRAWKKARDEDESIKANMIQYNLLPYYLDIFVGDFANCPLHERLTFDSIICDPPYGVREALAKIEKKERRMKFTAMTEDAIHYPSLSEYKVMHLYHDLLDFAVKHLKMDGRLVCWFPIPDKFYDEKIFPRHTALNLIATSKQPLIGDTSRILLTYEKISNEGEIVNKDETADLDFRLKYFTQYDQQMKDEREANRLRNIEEAKKRGVKLHSKAEWKKHINKKRYEEANKPKEEN